ncbi:unnamed protein product, partial [Hapterophycus canaliculatus]
QLPEGKEAVLACAQLQMERNRTRQLDRAAKPLPEASRRAEDQLRRAFFSEVGTVLTSLGAAPALRAPKKLHGDAGVCFRAIGFLAARVSGRQRRRSSAPAAGAATVLTSASSSSSAYHNGNRGPVGNATNGGENIGIGGQNTGDVSNTSGKNEDDGKSDSASDRNSPRVTSGAAQLDDGGPSGHSFEQDLRVGVDGNPSPSPLRTAGVRTTQTPRPSRRRRLPAGGNGLDGGEATGCSGGAAAVVGAMDRSTAATTAEHAGAAAIDGASPLSSERALRKAESGSGGGAVGKLAGPRTRSATAVASPAGRERLEPDNTGGRHGEEHPPRGSAERGEPERVVRRLSASQRGRGAAGVAGGCGGGGGVATRKGAPLLPPPPLAQTLCPGVDASGEQRDAASCSSLAAEGKAGAEEASSFRRGAPRSAGTARLRRPGISREDRPSFDSGGGGGGSGGFDLDGNYSGGFRDALGLEMSVVGEVSSGANEGGSSGSRGRVRKR